MGNSTIVEFNHDRMHEIFESEESKKKFLEQLQNQMNFGYPNYEWRKDDSILGGRIVLFTHRDDSEYKKFVQFRISLRKRGTI